MVRGFFALIAVLYLGASVPASAKIIDVVTSFSVLADVVKNVGGDHVRVTSLVPPNGDPHRLEPSPDDMKRLRNSAVTFISGNGLEHWFAGLAKSAGVGKPVVVSEGIKTFQAEEDGKTIIDPHVWNNVQNVLTWVTNIESALIKADPADAAYFKATSARYKDTLRELDTYVRAQTESLPKDRRTIVTSHDAFQYYARAYGMTFLAPQGVSTETEASAADVAALVDQIKSNKVAAVFLENSTNNRIAEQLSSLGQRACLGVLYPEALSPPGGPVRSYVGMIRYNTDRIVTTISRAERALGCI